MSFIISNAAAESHPDSDEGFRISPHIFMGIFAFSLSFVAYLISSTSLGKRSLSHAWLFSGLVVLNPSEKSLRLLGMADDSSATESTNSKRRHRMIKDVAGLELTCKSILPGAVPLSVMTAKDRASFLEWQALDAAVCIWLACLVATASPFILAWYTVYQEGNACCGDLQCWLKWWREQMGGPGLIYTDSPPPNLMLIAIGSISIWFNWRLVIHSTRLPERSVFRFSPFSYINGWLACFATFTLLRWTNSDTTTINTYQSFLGISLKDALDEWSARVTLWIGLTGFYLPDNEASREIVMNNTFYATQLVFSFSVGLLAFSVADPLRITMRVYFRNVFGDPIKLVDTTNGKYSRLLQKTQQQFCMMALAFLPVLCMGSYFVPVSTLGGFSPRTMRAAIGWTFIACLAILARPLLRSHLLGVIPEANLLFRTIRKPSSEDILSPFQKRSKSLLSTGGQLLIFPAFVLVVLTLGHSAGQEPTAVSDTNTITAGIYPFAFHQSVWTEEDEKTFQEWEEFQAKASAQNHLDDASVLANLTTTRANIGLCPNNISFSFLEMPTSRDVVGEASPKQGNANGYSAPIYHVSKSSQLITSKLVYKTTFVRVLRKLQQLAGKARLEPMDTASSSRRQAKIDATKDLDFEKETQEAQQNFHSFVRALAFHPLLTSTVLLPVMDFYGLVLNYLWIVYFAYFGLESWTRRDRRRRYDLFVKGEDCRVIVR